MSRRGSNVRSTCRCIRTGTPGTTTATAPRRRRGSGTRTDLDRGLESALVGPPEVVTPLTLIRPETVIPTLPRVNLILFFLYFLFHVQFNLLRNSTTTTTTTTTTIVVDTNQWHELPKNEQAKYYEKSRMERELHMYNYPNWSAKDNYARQKKLRNQEQKLTELFSRNLPT